MPSWLLMRKLLAVLTLIWTFILCIYIFKFGQSHVWAILWVVAIFRFLSGAPIISHCTWTPVMTVGSSPDPSTWFLFPGAGSIREPNLVGGPGGKIVLCVMLPHHVENILLCIPILYLMHYLGNCEVFTCKLLECLRSYWEILSHHWRAFI